ncbi:Serine palmitoyltransferase [Trachipleistophora hominis]|uniref:serine C-palmitoyltransferase n=1 Tax=Trachipleistophora hominis TaxID=72359 RepID=L7K025_TRAHO|nr:Serine palmitoyltransferase [Trachipleistophora hominis]
MRFKTNIQGIIMSYKEFFMENWQEIIRIFFELTIVGFFIKFKLFHHKSNILVLSDQEVQRLVDSFAPSPLINTDTDSKVKYNFGTMIEMADYDFFSICNYFKDEIKQTIRHYGVGTCGPPGFYGTLDLHLELEKKIANLVGLSSAILYCNSFTCVNSVITCFCRRGDIIFYHRCSNEAILRGLYATKATTIEFDMCTLEEKLSRYVNRKQRNFIIAEGLFRNTGKILDLPKILEMKRKFPLRLIVDESLSIPLLDKHGISTFYGTDVNDIDIIIGSFAHTFCSNGAFAAGNMHVVDYQRLLAPAYCFSASLPAFLTKFVLLALELPFHLFDARRIHEEFRSIRYTIISDKRSPIIVIRMNDTGKNELKNAIDKAEIGLESYEFAKACRCMEEDSTESEYEKNDDYNTRKIDFCGIDGQPEKQNAIFAQDEETPSSTTARQGHNLNMKNKLQENTDELIIRLNENDEDENNRQEKMEEMQKEHALRANYGYERVIEDCCAAHTKTDTPILTRKDKQGVANCEEEKKRFDTKLYTSKSRINTLNNLRYSTKLSQILREFDLSSTDLDKIPTKTAKATYNTEERFRIALLLTMEKKVKEFAKKNIRVGLVTNPEPGIRICVKNEMSTDVVEKVIKCMNVILN